jgi:hypothetical protein
MNRVYTDLLARLASTDFEVGMRATVELAFHLEEHYQGIVDAKAREAAAPDAEIYQVQPASMELEELVARARCLIKVGRCAPGLGESLRWALSKTGEDWATEASD